MTALRAGVKLAGFIAMTLPGLPVQRALIALSARGARRFPHLYHRAVTRWLDVRVNIIGQPVKDRPCLIASNHVSWLDITVLSAVTPLSFIAKQEVNSWPGFGTLARLQRTVFIDRARRQSTGSSLDEMQERLKAGETLVLFAEGTSSDGSRVLPFKSAYFAAAESPGVVVQPVTLAYRGHWGIPMMRRHRPLYAWYGDMDMAPHLWQALAHGPIEVDVICHAPLTVAKAGNRKELARQAEEAVRRGLVQAMTRPEKSSRSAPVLVSE
jgi:1-acyl-sn-glycerol-3-phosphate acyltransferase